ncbi:DUF1490 family protein [Mycobacterium sp.]|uniref:DUF1490 family protein n=1 Tax=Mycobacterium sp. TaxID=1785 RepID=UPI003BABFB73
MPSWNAHLAKTAPTVVTGVVGLAAYEALRKAASRVRLRKATVIATAWGLRIVREAERKAALSAEQARLSVADVMAEARDRAGEEGSPLLVLDVDGAHEH